MSEFADLEIGLHRRDTEPEAKEQPEPRSYDLDLRFVGPNDDGEVRAHGVAAFDFVQLRKLREDVAAYGKLLSDHLFKDRDVLDAFRRARTSAQAQEQPLRLRLFVGPHAQELHELRWETLRDPEDGAPLFTGEQIVQSRYLSSDDWRPVRLRPRSDLKALVVIANPSDLAGWELAAVDVSGELGRAKEALGSIPVTPLASGGTATLNDLVQNLRDGHDILYLVCHGALKEGKPVLYLESPAGKVGKIEGSELVTRVAELKQQPRLVVLASCQSAGSGREARSADGGVLAALGPCLAEVGIPAVLAMQGNITMDTVEHFMPVFFHELQRDGQIDRAVSAARGRVRERLDYWAPVLFMRLRSGCIWSDEEEKKEEEEDEDPVEFKLNNVPELPPKYLPREEELAELKKKLLGDGESAVGTGGARKVCIHGMIGSGKSVLAAALAHDEDMRRAFPDGVVWVTLGEKPRILRRQVQVANLFAECPQAFADKQQGRAALSDLLREKALLLILDDARYLRHVEGLNVLGPKSKLLLTARDRGLIDPLGAEEYHLHVLSHEKALELLAMWSDEPVEDLPAEAGQIAEECGHLPLTLAMIGAMEKRRPDSWKTALQRLKNADLEKIKFPGYPYPNLLRAIQVVIEALDDRIEGHYYDFAIFREDTPVPEPVFEALWGLSVDDTREILDEFANQSLVRRDSRGRLTLHDLPRDYLRKWAGDLAARHERLLEGYKARSPGGWHTGPDDGYFFEQLPFHLAGAGRKEELRSLLLDFDWLQVKLEKTEPASAISDYDLLPQDVPLRLMQRFLRLSGHVLARDRTQLASQLWGRLQPHKEPLIRDLLAKAALWKVSPWLRPLGATLRSPDGPLLLTLVGHAESVTAVSLTADGRKAVSASKDNTLRVWDLEKGKVLHVLEGHSRNVMGVSVTADGRKAVSSSTDGTLKVWDIEEGKVLHTLEGHSEWVMAVSVTADGAKAVSGSAEGILKVWDLETGEALLALNDGSARFTAVSVTADGKKAVSGSQDGTLKVWDLERGVALRALEGHSSKVTGVSVTADGRRAISASDDKTLKVWDLEKGEALHTLECHSHWVLDVSVTADGKKTVIGSWDGTLKVLDLEKGKALHSLEDSGEALAVSLAADGRKAVIGSRDGTLKVWELETDKGLHPLEGHSEAVLAVSLTADGRRAISGSLDGILKVWDIETGKVFHTLEDPSAWVLAMSVTADGRKAVCACGDMDTPASELRHTVKVWDLETGKAVHTLEGHSAYVTDVSLTADGKRAVSASSDGTLMVWDLEEGKALLRLEGHSGEVLAASVMADGSRAVSGSSDRTLKVWDLETGKALHTLEGHSGEVLAVSLTADGRRAISGSTDMTLKVWDLETGKALQTLDADKVTAAPVTADGRRAVSVSLGGVPEAEKARALHRLEGYSRRVSAVSVTADGKYAVCASSDRIIVWDLETGRAITTFHGDGWMDACAIAQGGEVMIVGERSGRVHLLRLEGLIVPG
jgi:WD40 repeat protein